MAGTTYTYHIRLQGGQAITDARKFKENLERELAKIKFTAKVDMGQIETQLRQGLPRAASIGGALAGNALQKAMQRTVDDFSASMMRLAPQTFGEPMKEFLAQSLVAPSEEAITQLNLVEEAVKKTAAATRKMGVGIDEWAGMGKMEQFATAMQAAQRRWWGVRGMGYQIQAYGRGAMMAGAAGLGGMALAMKEYLQYAQPMNRAARNLELNAEMTDLLNDRLIELAGTVSYFTPEEQAEQLYLWAAATGEVVDNERELNTVLERTASVQKLAVLGMVTQGQAVEAVTDIQSQYQLSVEDTEKIVATMVKVAAVSKAEVSDLAMAFAYAGARADQSNTSFEETAAVLQILAAYGMRGSRAGRGLARLFENLIAPSEAAKSAMDDLFSKTLGRTDVFIDAQGNFIGLADAVTVLDEATRNLTQAEKQEFVARITTENAARVLIPLLQMQAEARKRNIDAIGAQQNIIEGLVGTHEQAYINMVKDVLGYEVSSKSALDTLDDQWEQFTNSEAGRAQLVQTRWTSAITQIGQSATDLLIGPLESLSRWFKDFVDRAVKDGKTIQNVFGGLLTLLGLGGAAMVAGKGITLYADVKAILMAKNLMTAANTQLTASLNMLMAARIQAGAAGAGLARAGAGAAAGVGAQFAGAITWGGIAKALAGAMAVYAGPILIGHAAITISQAGIRADQAAVEGFTEREIAAITAPPSGSGPTYKPSPSPFKVAAGQIVWRQGELKGQAVELQEVRKWLVLTGKASETTRILFEYYSQTVEEQTRVLDEEARRLGKMTSYTSLETLAMERLAAVSEAVLTVQRAMGMVFGRQAKDLEHIGGAYGLTIAWMEKWNTVLASQEVTTMRAVRYYGDLRDAILDVRHAIPSAADLVQEAAATAGEGWQQFTGLVGIMSPEEIKKWGDAYEINMLALYMDLLGEEQWFIDLSVEARKREWAEKIQLVQDAHSEMKQAQEQYYDDVQRFHEQAQSQFRQMVGQALQPTAVTAEDVWATNVGVYEDKWDEYARRLRAAAQGSERWKDLIPADLWGDEQARAQWAQQQLDDFYAGLLPDQVDWEAFVDQFAAGLRRETGRETLIDRAIEELAARGITAERADVLAALGLESPLQRMYFGGLSPTEAGKQLQSSVGTAMEQVTFDPTVGEGPAQSFVSAFSSGMTTWLERVSWAASVVNAWQANMSLNTTVIEGVGKSLGDAVFTGVQKSMTANDFVAAVVAEVQQQIADYLEGLP